MTLTLLLDLDDTLLQNHIDQFLPAYMQALARFLTPLAPPEQMAQAFMHAVRQMMANRSPDITLEQAFLDPFNRQLGVEDGVMREAITRFYAQEFSQLSDLTAPIPAAQALVREAIQRGYRVVVATNPLFPATAIHQRLAWAGLSVDDYPFALITSADQFHYTKSSPAYYAEILARLGWPEGPVVMVGDDPELDITSARALGLPTFQVETNARNAVLMENDKIPAGHGSLDGLLPWLDSLSPEQLLPEYKTPAAILATLSATPAALNSMSPQISASGWSTRPEKNEWSPVEIVCHLRDVEKEVNLPRLQRVLAEENPFISGEDTDPWAAQRKYIDQEPLPALISFQISRLELLGQLEQLPVDGWQRTARHAIFGRTTLIELINIIAGHDRLHLRQFFHLL